MASFTDKEVYHFLGERGVYSCDEATLRQCFEIFRHEQGIFCYRLKPHKAIRQIKPTNRIRDGLFNDVVLHDPMQHLLTREEDGDEVFFMRTHYDGEETDVLENERGMAYDVYLKHKDAPLTQLITLRK